MKVESFPVPPPPAEIAITLSQDEAKLLHSIVGANWTIAKVLTNAGEDDTYSESDIADFLDRLYWQLDKEVN